MKTYLGVISSAALNYVLTKDCGLDEIELSKLKEVLDPLQKDVIQYGYLLRMLWEYQNPTRRSL